MRSEILVVALILLCSAGASFGQENRPELDPANYTRLLLPIAFSGDKPGAFGSVWRTDLAFRNDGFTPVVVTQVYPLCQITCPGEPIVGRVPARSTGDLLPDNDTSSNINFGILVYVEKHGMDSVFWSVRVRDVSRSQQALGVEVPVVREKDSFEERAVILNIPHDPLYRVLVRVYSFNGPGEVSAAIIPSAQEHNTSTMTLGLRGGSADGTQFVPNPGYAQVSIMESTLPVLAGSSSFRIEFQSLTPGLKFWPMVSVTNNDTQHVTIATAQR
jgi:hypothetical protein